MKSESLIWYDLPSILGKMSRGEVLTLGERGVLIGAQDLDVNRYRRMRERYRSEDFDWGSIV